MRQKLFVIIGGTLLAIAALIAMYQLNLKSAHKEAAEAGDMPKFSAIEYERPDLAAFTAKYEGLTADLKANRLSVSKAVERLEDAYDDYNRFYTMNTIAQLRYYHDITDDFYADEFDWFSEHEPVVDQLFDGLCTASANCTDAEALDEQFWGGWVVDAYQGEGGATLDPEYLALAQKENAILTEYRRITADPTVLWKGKEQSFLALQEDASIIGEEWDEIRTLYYDKYSEILGKLYIRLVGVRQELAAYLGLDSYEDYAYAAIYERDYSPEQTQTMLQHIREDLAPLYQELDLNRRWEELRYTTLTKAQNLAALRNAATAMGGTVLEAFQDLEQYELYDIDVSEKKGTLSYECYLYSYDNPFVFVKTEGFSDDILDFGHEFGHFVDDWYNHNATTSHDLSEVFSQGMEFLLLSRVPKVYRRELTTYKLLDCVDTFTQQGSYAAFEHEVYARPAAEWTPEKLNALSLHLAEDYGYLDPGQEDYYAKSWVDITHLFESPFYVVSYCVSNCAAFELYELECEQAGSGLDYWNRMLPRDHDGFLETVTEQGGLSDPFAPESMREAADLLRLELGK